MADVKTNAKCINKGRPVYFSYARNSSKQPGWDHISDCVDEIIAIFKEQNIEYRLDRDDIGAGDSISEFEKEIGWNSEVVVLVFSDKYFHSPHCMYEFIQIKNAIKKYPKKRLFCIKAGDFDLSDRNYIRELEHFWGTKKLDYEEIEYHRIRKHSGTEKAARQNGFYINEIRELESYFANTNYVEASNQDWNGFVNKITDYYESAPKSPFYAQMQRKLSLSKFRFFVFGIILLAFLMVVVPNLIWYFFFPKSIEIEIPEYEQNDFFDSTQITYITKIKVREKQYTQVFFRSINLTDEYPRKVLRNTTPHLIVDGKNYYFTSVQSSDGNLMQEHFQGGKGTVVDYQMLFPTIPIDAETIDYVEGDGRGIFGISMIRDNKISIDHPAYNAGLSEVVVKKIDVNTQQTILYCRFFNLDTCDNEYCVLPDWYIVANGEKYTVKNALGLFFEPTYMLVNQEQCIDFALFFPAIPSSTDSIDFVINNDFSISGLKLKRNSLVTVDKPLYRSSMHDMIKLLKVEITEDATILHLSITNDEDESFFCYLNPTILIEVEGKRYPLKDVSGICPQSANFLIPKGATQTFALFFAPIPKETEKIDFYYWYLEQTDYTDEEYEQMVKGYGLINEGDYAYTGIFDIELSSK